MWQNPTKSYFIGISHSVFLIGNTPPAEVTCSLPIAKIPLRRLPRGKFRWSRRNGIWAYASSSRNVHRGSVQSVTSPTDVIEYWVTSQQVDCNVTADMARSSSSSVLFSLNHQSQQQQQQTSRLYHCIQPDTHSTSSSLARFLFGPGKGPHALQTLLLLYQVKSSQVAFNKWQWQSHKSYNIKTCSKWSNKM